MGREFPGTADTSAQLVFTAPAGQKVMTSASLAAAIDQTLADAAKAPQVVKVTAPAVDLGGAALGGGGGAQPGVQGLIGVGVIVLAVTFGSLLAALAGVVAGVAGVSALTGAVPISSTALTLALMIGLAVGIDYALFILPRHRSQLAQRPAP
ncbi:MMPL family transporter [Streptomyces sp. NPDC005389]|uniref:MMPL family transporter n=1 Tax=Streptomyces sp. NPDC005389 TaxID=3157040 RepID=UPI0033A18670